MKKLKVTVDGKAYHVTVEPLDKNDSPPKASDPAPPAQNPAPKSMAVPSPLAGKVVTIHVQAGQTVKKDDPLMVLEAMKMNTYLYAPQNGNIAGILVSEGDAVEEGQSLITMD